jgi:hypothetical protein
MADMRIEVSGWRAIAVGVLALAVFGGRAYRRVENVPDDGREALRTWLVKEYTGRGLKDVAQRLADHRAGLPDQPLELPAVMPQVEFVSLSAHGWRSDSMIVRTEISVDGGPPPDGRSIRYLFLTTKVEGGWMVLSESDSYSYYSALFR